MFTTYICRKNVNNFFIIIFKIKILEVGDFYLFSNIKFCLGGIYTNLTFMNDCVCTLALILLCSDNSKRL